MSPQYQQLGAIDAYTTQSSCTEQRKALSVFLLLSLLVVICAVQHHGCVLFDERCCRQAHLEVHLASAYEEEVRLQLCNPAGRQQQQRQRVMLRDNKLAVTPLCCNTMYQYTALHCQGQ